MISIVKVRQDLSGQKFVQLTVLQQTEDYIRPNGQHSAQYLCECDCGRSNPFKVLADNLKKGKTQRCKICQYEVIGQTRKKYNEYKIENNIVYIKLSNCDVFTTVNLDKWNSISYIKEFCWYRGNNGYAWATLPKKYRKHFNNKKLIGLHQLVCPCEKGCEPDHLDRNKLNNLTNNLKPKTRSENMMNIGLRANNKSGHTGVGWNKKLHKWYAEIKIQGKTMRLGLFDNINDAVKSYEDTKAKYYSNTL